MMRAYDQVVFSGGGIRCFWHGGFMSVVGDFEDVRPARISSASGGALSAATWIGGRETDLLAVMSEAFRHNSSNVDADSSNFTPHQEIYRAVVEVTLDQEAIERIMAGPVYEVYLSVPPKHVAPRAAAALYGVLYKLDQAVRSTPHLTMTTAAGLQHLCVDARQAARDGRLVDLICAAATIPPVFDVPDWDGKRVLDGGMFDKAPLPSSSRGETLVLLTSRYRNLPQTRHRTYVQPSREVAADKIDFTDASKVTDTWDQGERDGEAWLAKQKEDS
ncbi:patatin-like phospholipase family protein [Aurantiacibacter aquimixticola]|uniref:Patatin-like phospholipase family protein n=1 Tax=Aurantiacibacter aquimixticola TaxID=1958945 RepID=A0A419RQD4_9SPHN|nr:patatin-like phospholipase family protein [Aurantiacibacter aquimixticola]RJY08018.1 patatin-like phospholipase family protein [Aurantiacibacter aquimixticola]